MTVYATTDDYLTYIGEAYPDNRNETIDFREASERVTDFCRGDIYATDEDGVALAPATAKAMREATILQVRAWAKNDIDPEGEPDLEAGDAVISSSARSASFTKSDAMAQNAAARRRQMVTKISPKAAARLRRAGLGSRVISQ